jgi:hypothetical protein
MDNEEGVRLLEDGGEIEVPIDAIEHSAAIRLLEEAAEGGHGDGEIGKLSVPSFAKHPPSLNAVRWTVLYFRGGFYTPVP